jgi:hypothetical protein
MWVGVGLELIFNFFWIRRRNGSEASWPARISDLSRRQRADLHVGQFKGVENCYAGNNPSLMKPLLVITWSSSFQLCFYIFKVQQ